MLTEHLSVTDEQTQVAIIFDAMKQWINQRSKLDFADYGDRTAFGQDSRQVSADGTRARKALAEARSLQPARLDVLLDSFRAFSGRLQWIGCTCGTCSVCNGPMICGACTQCARCTGHAPSCKWSCQPHLSYTTGQYWPTEYRKAAASVLETYCSAWRAAEAREKPKTFVYVTLDDVEAANRSIGNHWFDRDTMRFFKTKIESRLIAGHRFVTSERGPDERRRYTVRDARPDGTIDTIGEFQGYATRKAAMAKILYTPEEVSK